MEKELGVKKNIILKLDKIASLVLFVGIFLTSILFLPLFNFSPEVTKKFLLIGSVLIALFLWSLARFKEKKIVLTKSPSLAIGGLFLILTFISSVLAVSPVASLFGLGFEAGTFLSLAILFSLLFLFSEYARSKRIFLNIYWGLFAIFIIAFIFQATRLIFGNFLPWNIFSNGAVNLIGKWYDFGIFAGLIALSAVAILEFFPLKDARLMKNLIRGILIITLLTLALVNFSLLWWFLLIISLAIFLYDLYFVQIEKKKKIFKTSLVVFIFALVFVVFGQPLSYDAQGKPHEGYLTVRSRILSEKLGIASLEVRPSYKGTFSVIKESLRINPVFGTGPNTFSQVWLKNKPAGVNESSFWNIEPAFGVSFVSTFFVTAGLLGGLTLLFFILSLVYFGVKALINPKIESLDKSFLILSLVGIIYLWSLLIFYVFDTSVLAITFMLTGLFIARLIDLKEIKTVTIDFLTSKKTKILAFSVATLVGVFLLLLTVSWFATIGALIALERSTHALQVKGDADRAEKYIKIATRLNPQDVYYRLASQVNISQMGVLLNKKMSQTEMMDAYSKLLEKARINVDQAISINNQNYANYISRGYLYENIMSLGVKGAYELAKENYLLAIDYNPSGPDMYLNLARLEIANKNYTEAEKYLERSLAEKKNYIDAIFLQSQLYAQRGFLDSAIKRAEYASQLAPTDTTVLFQLGYLQYRNADYRGAIKTLKSAVTLIPNFANARYFLGLSYDKIGLTDSAIKEFVEIEKSNPDNAELTQILLNLRAGRDALVGAEPVEKKVNPPIKQN